MPFFQQNMHGDEQLLAARGKVLQKSFKGARQASLRQRIRKDKSTDSSDRDNLHHDRTQQNRWMHKHNNGDNIRIPEQSSMISLAMHRRTWGCPGTVPQDNGRQSLSNV